MEEHAKRLEETKTEPITINSVADKTTRTQHRIRETVSGRSKGRRGEGSRARGRARITNEQRRELSSHTQVSLYVTMDLAGASFSANLLELLPAYRAGLRIGILQRDP